MADATYYFDTTPSHDLNVTASAKDVLGSPGNFFEAGDLSWMITSSALVLLMIPGTGLLYSGMSRNSSLSMVWMPTATAVVVGFVWFLWGYAVTFSPAMNVFWGGSDGVVFHNALIRPVGIPNGPKIPELLYALYQGMFACFTAGLVSGATIFKERTYKFMIFAVFWTTLIYCPIAHWSWNPQGWAYKWGTYDFAGGTPVHICSGASSLAYVLFFRFWTLGRYNSQNSGDVVPEENYTRTSGYNAVSVVTGTVMLWIGWFGFNGGSALGANLRAVSACVSTTLAACSGGITAFLLNSVYTYFHKSLQEVDSQQYRPKTEAQWLQDLIEAVSAGIVVGMVAVTPGAGYTPYYWAPLFGIIAELICFYVARYSSAVLFDPLSIFTIHGVAGFVGMLLTGFFARSDVAALDGYTKIPGGCNLHDKNCSQLYKQLGDALAGLAYSFGGTLIILCIMEVIEIAWRRAMGRDRPKPKLVVDL